MNKLIITLAFVVTLVGCNYRKSVDLDKYYRNLDSIIIPITDSLQKDNIVMDKKGLKNLSDSEKTIYLRNIDIGILLAKIEIRFIKQD